MNARNKFQQVYEENPEKALVDLGEFLHYSNIGELDPNLTKQFAKYYVQMGNNAEELIDKETAKQIIFPDEKDVFADEENNHEINSSEIEILDSKISIDDFVQAGTLSKLYKTFPANLKLSLHFALVLVRNDISVAKRLRK